MLIGNRQKKLSLENVFHGAVCDDVLPLSFVLKKFRHWVGIRIKWSLMRLFKEEITLHKFIRLRQRNILTRTNRVRLRYVTSVALSFVCAGYFALADIGVPVNGISVSGVSPYLMAHLSPAAGDEEVGESIEVAASEPNAKVVGVLQERVSDSMRRAPAAFKKAPKRDFEEIEIGRGDTIAGVLENAGLSGEDSYDVVKALSEHFDPRNVRPGQKLSVHFKPGSSDESGEFTKVTVQVDPVKEITISKSGETFKAAMVEKDLVKHVYAGKAEIKTSLYGSAARSGIPAQVIAEMIRIYSWNIDFQRDIQPGDKIEVLYEAEETKDGEYSKYGNLLYANLTVGGKDVPIYRYEMKDGRVDYFQPDGMSVRKTLMKTPIDGARISSGFGMRRHPVLGYNKMHKGMDFAAPTGTPIFAAGDGVLEHAGRFSSYGNYIRIRHNSKLKTAYGHMHRLAKGMRPGAHVKQGDVIGYVGTTGRSTGPHLHYEVMVNNTQVNPKSVDLPTGEQLQGKQLAQFKSIVKSFDKQFYSLSQGMKFAQNLFFPSSDSSSVN